MQSNRIFPITSQIVASTETPNRDYRLDPSRYNERGERMLRHLKQLGIEMPFLVDMPEFKQVYLPNRFSRIYIDDKQSGAPMLGTSTMLLSRLPVDSRIKLEESELKSFRILPGDILISRSGTVGTSVLCGESYSNYVASDDCFRLRVTKEIRGYVVAYLSSPFGKTLLVRDAHGKVIKHLKERDIKTLRLPLIPAPAFKQVNSLMLDSVRLVDEARHLLIAAETEIYKTIGITGETSSPELWLNRENRTFLKASNSLFDHRLDPHFHNPDINHLRVRLTAMPHKPLGKIADVWGVSRFKRIRADKGHGTPLFSSADILRAKQIPSGYLSTARSKRNITQCTIEDGTILIPCSGTFGGIMGHCVRAGKRLHKQAVTQHVLRIKVTDPDFVPDYVAAFLGTIDCVYPIITAFRYGKDVPELEPDHLKLIPVPMIDRKDQERIAEYVSAAYSNIDTANHLEDQAEEILLSALNWMEEEIMIPEEEASIH